MALAVISATVRKVNNVCDIVVKPINHPTRVRVNGCGHWIKRRKERMKEGFMWLEPTTNRKGEDQMKGPPVLGLMQPW